MPDRVPATPLRFNDTGDGWHLSPRRRFLQRGLIVGAALLVGASAVGSIQIGNLYSGLGTVLVVVLGLGVAFEPRAMKSPRMYESPTVYGLLLPTHPVKLSTIALMSIAGGVLCLGPFFAILLGQGEGSVASQLVACLIGLLIGIVFVAGAAGGIASRRSPHRGILLTIDGVVLQTQKPSASFSWHQCSGLRRHWTRLRSARNSFLTPDDVVLNWLTFAVDPADVDGRAPLTANARTSEPTVNAKDLAVDPHLVWEVCIFYLDDAEARGELRTPAALDRVASIERALGSPA